MEISKAIQLNPLSLAFVGDATFTLFVREKLALEHDNKAGKLHVMANKYVKATAQACIFDALSPLFNETEKDVARRARNHHNNTKAKNASLADYKKATSLEAVLGFLKIIKDDERLLYFMESAIKIIDENVNEGENNE